MLVIEHFMGYETRTYVIEKEDGTLVAWRQIGNRSIEIEISRDFDEIKRFCQLPDSIFEKLQINDTED